MNCEGRKYSHILHNAAMNQPEGFSQNGYQPGDHIAIRNVFRGRVQTVFPSIVVVDTPELVVTWLPLDTPVLNGVDDASADVDSGKGHISAEKIAAKSWEMGARRWHIEGTLRIKHPRSMWSLWVFWEPGMGSIKGWYINIDAPYTRSHVGFDTCDMFLDVIIKPDRESWWLKDEDEFEDAINAGIFDEKSAAEVRKAAESGLQTILSNRPPFDTVWADWRPDTSWLLPQIPADWERVD